MKNPFQSDESKAQAALKLAEDNLKEARQILADRTREFADAQSRVTGLRHQRDGEERRTVEQAEAKKRAQHFTEWAKQNPAAASELLHRRREEKSRLLQQENLVGAAKVESQIDELTTALA